LNPYFDIDYFVLLKKRKPLCASHKVAYCWVGGLSWKQEYCYHV